VVGIRPAGLRPSSLSAAHVKIRTMKVLAVHPGPIVHVPPRARIERLSFDRVQTPIEIPGASGSEMPLAGQIEEWRGVNLMVAFHEGTLWTPVRDPLQKPMSAPAFAALLAGTTAQNAQFPDNLFLSPLHVPAGAFPARPTRGMAIEVGRAGRIGEDFRERARAAVRAFAEANLRLRDGEPWCRIPGPFLVRDDAVQEGYRLSVRPYADANIVATDLFCAPEAIEAHRDHFRRVHSLSGPGGKACAGMRAHGVEVPLPSSRTDTLHFAANRGVICAHHEIGYILKKDNLGEDSRAALRAARERLSPYLPLASISAIPASEAADSILAMNAALAQAIAGTDPRTVGHSLLRRQARWSAAAFTPRIEVRVPIEDIETLDALGAATRP